MVNEDEEGKAFLVSLHGLIQEHAHLTPHTIEKGRVDTAVRYRNAKC